MKFVEKSNAVLYNAKARNMDKMLKPWSFSIRADKKTVKPGESLSLRLTERQFQMDGGLVVQPSLFNSKGIA
jgi:hypothetical protein